mmetsp:Transcript_64253/g.196557  ORF Transcript_64253/g.196557 Transcript_64253/m.196557 type:complete len:226 (-) Transcript_64253:855-1532(-)
MLGVHLRAGGGRDCPLVCAEAGHGVVSGARTAALCISGLVRLECMLGHMRCWKAAQREVVHLQPERFPRHLQPEAEAARAAPRQEVRAPGLRRQGLRHRAVEQLGARAVQRALRPWRAEPQARRPGAAGLDRHALPGPRSARLLPGAAVLEGVPPDCLDELVPLQHLVRARAHGADAVRGPARGGRALPAPDGNCALPYQAVPGEVLLRPRAEHSACSRGDRQHV